MKKLFPLLAAVLLPIGLATPSFAQVSINPLGLDGDPLHAFSPPAPPPPAPAYVIGVHHKHHRKG